MDAAILRPLLFSIAAAPLLVLAARGDARPSVLPTVAALPSTAQPEVIVASSKRTLADAHTLQVSDGLEAIPVVVSSIPNAEAIDANPRERISVRFSRPLDVSTLNKQTVTLVGPEGGVAGKIVSAERGHQFYFVPDRDLLPGSRYTLFVKGASTQLGKALPFTSIGFATSSSPLKNELVATNSEVRSPTTALAASVRLSTGSDLSSVRPGCATGIAVDQYCRDQAIVDRGFWFPSKNNLHGNWRINGKYPLVPDKRLLASRSIGAGTTGVYGQVLRIDDMPIANVTVSVGERKTQTDEQGVFVLTQIPAGHQVIHIDGATANHGDMEFGGSLVSIEIKASTMSPLPQVSYLPRIHAQDKIEIPSPTTSEVVITHPEIPGLEIHIPANTVIEDRDGHALTELAIVPMPIDRFTVPSPTNFQVGFSVQPEGATVHALSADAAAGIRITYPYDASVADASRYRFWVYDASRSGWQIYSRGQLSADGKHVVAENGFGDTSLIPTMDDVIGPDPPDVAPPPGACGDSCDAPGGDDPDSDLSDCPCGGADQSGEPIDNATGLYVLHRLDLSINDIVPIRVTRVYRSQQTTTLAFGPGTSLNYNMYLYSPFTTEMAEDYPPVIYLVLADGSAIPFYQVTGNLNDYGPGEWVSTVLGRFNGARLINLEGSSQCALCITLKDGTIYTFPAVSSSESQSWLQGIIDRFGNTLSISHSGNNLTQITSPSGRYVQVSYNANGEISQLADNSGRAVSYSYNAAGQLSTVTYSDTKTEQFTYDSNGNMLTKIDRRGHTVFTNQYDANQRVNRQTLSDGSFYQWSYTLSNSGTVTATDITDPNGSIRHVTFDNEGYPLTVTRASGSPVAQTTTYVRGPDEQPISVIDPMGRITTMAYDDVGNLLSRTYLSGTPDAVTYSYTYVPSYGQLITTPFPLPQDALGYTLVYSLLSTQTDPLGHIVTYQYNSAGCLTAVVDALGHSVNFTCNNAGQLTTVTGATGGVTTYSYTGLDLSAATDPLGRTISFDVDNLGRLKAITDPLGSIRQWQYDTNSRITSATDALNRNTVFGYDGDGNLNILTDINSHSTQWGYDNRNRVVSRTDALNQLESWTYDGLRNATSHTDRDSQITQYAYDSLNRISQITYDDGRAITPTYDAGNRVIQLTDSLSGTIAWTFDSMDRITQEQTPLGSVIYHYDAANRRIDMTPAGQSQVNYSYDAANRLTQIAQGSEIVTFAYDAANRRTVLTLPNGVTSAYTYDPANQLTGISYRTSRSVQLAALAYTYDGVGRIASKAGGFMLDPLPTPTTASATFDANNRQVFANGATLSYDANGNLLSDGSNTYTWNDRNELTAIAQGGTAVATFSYDALGRRIARAVGGITTSYLYDGINPIQETRGSTAFSILSGLGVDERFARSESSGRMYFLSDALGSTVALTDVTAVTSQTYAYEPYGEVSTTGTSNNPYQYTGRENDGTGLYYYRARYYSPSLKRFISEDPMGLAAGPNEYAYVGGNPVSFVDPLGLVAHINLLDFYTNVDGGLYGWAQDYAPPGYNSVVIHGNDTGGFSPFMDGTVVYTEREVASFLKQAQDYDPNSPTIMIACESGTSFSFNHPSSAQFFANALADPNTYPSSILPNTNTVYAPAVDVHPTVEVPPQGIPPNFIPITPKGSPQ